MAAKRSNQSPIITRLRPRTNKVNYCDDSKLIQQHLPLKHQDSLVILRRMYADCIKNETMKTSELSSDNDVYDFKYDRNDPKEKVTKKKKKRNVKIKSKTIKGTKSKTTKNIRKKATITQYPLERATIPLLTKLSKENVVEVIEMPEVNDQRREKASSCKDLIHLKSGKSDKPSAKKIEKQVVKKPKIVSIENANNITITKAAPGSSKDILPFRSSSNIPDNRSTIQHKNFLNSSLFMKSLSPILKEQNTFDSGSPWRPPQVPYMFSRSKHFSQSTPNVAKMDTIHKKRIIQVKDDYHNADIIANVNDTESKNTNSPVQIILDNKVNYKKNPNLCRKFGTEITNIEHLSNCSTIQGNNLEVVSEKPTEIETNSITNVQLDIIASPLLSSQSVDDTDDKENVAANCSTPKKSPKKKLKRRQLPNSSPSKVYGIKNIVQSENVDPRPGPSGIKNSKNCNEQKILRQSNLNNFFNLIDMPENTRINTKHGIFDDVHPSPINSSAIKKLANSSLGDLENAFGFCEKDVELDISPIKDNPIINKAMTKIQTNKFSTKPAPIRLSLGEVKNNLLKKKLNEKKTSNQQTIKKKNVEVSKPLEENKDNQLIDIVNFSDTFDVMSESERLSTVESAPLFVDLEPSYFSKPPQHSYKRKRAVTLNFSDDSEKEENEEKEIGKRCKKKKPTKSERENKKRLNEWVKTVNTTFEEIDQYDLLIE